MLEYENGLYFFPKKNFGGQKAPKNLFFKKKFLIENQNERHHWIHLQKTNKIHNWVKILSFLVQKLLHLSSLKNANTGMSFWTLRPFEAGYENLVILS